MNQDNKAYTEEKNKWIKNHTELMQAIEWTDTDVKAISTTVSHILNQFRNSLSFS